MYLKKTRKQRETQLYSRNIIKVINTCAAPPCKTLGVFLKVDEGKTSTNGLENKKTKDDA